MNSKDYFDHYYQKTLDFSYSESLRTFFETIVAPRLPGEPKILDIGCGSYSLFEDINELKAEITALDFSSEAIKRAPQSKIDYKNSSVVDATFFQDSSYDLVFDSHCLNCLTDEKERSAAYENIFKSLKKKALFASELMVQPIGKNISLPFKAIKTSIELEQEVLSHGFKIIYFMIVRGSTFTSEVDGVEIECDVLRLIAQK